jgi:hypothetical protein
MLLVETLAAGSVELMFASPRSNLIKFGSPRLMVVKANASDGQHVRGSGFAFGIQRLRLSDDPMNIA